MAWKCRFGRSNSEACVWARAYFPVSRWVEPAIVTPIGIRPDEIVVAMSDHFRN